MRDFKQIYMYTIYIKKTPKNPQQENKMNLKVELKNVLNEKPIKKSIKTFQINN